MSGVFRVCVVGDKSIKSGVFRVCVVGDKSIESGVFRVCVVGDKSIESEKFRVCVILCHSRIYIHKQYTYEHNGRPEQWL